MKFYEFFKICFEILGNLLKRVANRPSAMLFTLTVTNVPDSMRKRMKLAGIFECESILGNMRFTILL